MSLWVDKYRPKKLDDLDFHPHVTQQLQNMSATGDFGHILFYGPSGSGKKTRISAFLHAVYGPGAQKLKVDQKTFKLTATNILQLSTVASSYHIEINPSDAGFHDRHIVQEVVKEIAQSPPIEANNKTFKVLVLHEVDKLSHEAQAALRRTMEKYMSVCRLILICNSTSKVIEPVRSRCLGIRMASPSEKDICNIMAKVAKRENIILPDSVAEKIAKQSERNLRRALLMFESCKVNQYPFKENLTVDIPDWESYIVKIAKDIIADQSPRQLADVRGRLYELLGHCIPPEVILKKLLLALLNDLDATIKFEVTKWAAFYDHRLQCGNKPIFHLEAFVAKFMSIYKRFILSSMDLLFSVNCKLCV
eukprot:TRINITY_DN6862_c0_g1_i1.p1 TRINITY_DN6862_c0_g1~~TRINITY_DN6862_c0_g1_i1.p1  ORF type:complete len:363 (+),score=52.92 TRINITY_DN6862_c0_g1_i1:67-1155(+)